MGGNVTSVKIVKVFVSIIKDNINAEIVTVMHFVDIINIRIFAKLVKVLQSVKMENVNYVVDRKFASIIKKEMSKL
jgi:hypothetical protein